MPRETKDSGIEWIGEIPSTWKLCKIKHVCSTIGSGTTPKSGNLEFYENGTINWIQSGDLYNKATLTNVSTLITKRAFSSTTSLKLYIAPYIVIAMYGASVGNTAISTIDACTNQACCCLKPNTSTHLKYLFYWINHCKSDFLDKAEGGTQPNISQQKIANQYYLQPSFSEQQLIANFLDHKCDEIDALHADIEKQIATLEDYKKSIITEAVTKGLNPDVEMKDSEIEWIDTIPKTWIVSRLNYECYIRARLGWKGLKADEYVQEGYPFLSAFNIQNNHLVWFPLNFITQKRYDESPEIKLKIGDILLVKDGAGIGKTARIDTLPFNAATTNSSLGVLTPYSSLNYRYLSYYLQSAIFSNFINRLLNGMGVPHLTQEVLNKIKILIPSLHEQQEIADYLDQKTTEIDAIISAKKQQLDVLDNYKKSLIYEYVTGKKEVPSYANAE